jgi:hypothetical protein
MVDTLFRRGARSAGFGAVRDRESLESDSTQKASISRAAEVTTRIPTTRLDQTGSCGCCISFSAEKGCSGFDL